MTSQGFSSNNHWNYFLALDADVAQLARYLEPTEDNFAAYSIEMMRILFAAASEIDVVAKMYCCKINKNKKAENINDYRKIIISDEPRISETQVRVPRYGLSFKPWNKWADDDNPNWWCAYNAVKHHRDTNFADANLENSINAVAGLFVFLLFYFRDESQNGLLSPDPILFRAGSPFSSGRNLYEPYSEIYQL